MLVKAIIVAIWAGMCSIDDKFFQVGFRRPLPAGFVTGVLLGDPVQGLTIGATMELMWLGIGNVGAYTAPDVVAGSVIGTAIGILTGGGAAAAVAIGVPLSLLSQQFLVLWNTVASFLLARADKAAEEGDFSKIKYIHYLGTPFIFFIRAVPTFLAVYLGADSVQKIIEMLPENIMTGLDVSSKIIPAVGIAVLLNIMLKGNSWIYFLLGFTLVSYLELPLLAVSFIGIVFAGIVDFINVKFANKKEEVVEKKSIKNDDNDSEGEVWDL